MHRIVSGCLILISLVFVMGLAACGGEQPTPPPEADLPPGDELVSQMKEAVEAANSAHFTAQFQVASVKGPVKGTVEFWGERPGKMRAEVTSELPSVDGIVAVTNGEQGWVYNPRENLVVVADKSQYKAQLRDQPELRNILEFLEKMIDRGFDNTDAVNQGAEQVNGRDTYKVQVTYQEVSDPEVDLSGLTAIFWIDQETSLPQRLEMTVDREAFTASGFVALEGEMVIDQPIEAQFSFEPPEGVTVLDMSELPPLPSFEDLPQVQ